MIAKSLVSLFVVTLGVLLANAITLVLLVGTGFVAIPPGLTRGKTGEVDRQRMITEKVHRGDLIATVTGKGVLESANNVAIRCQVEGGSRIAWIVENGEMVKKGDRLVELDKSALEDQISQQQINCNRATAERTQAEEDLKVAAIAVTEYEQGTYPQELKAVEARIALAQENLAIAKNALADGDAKAEKREKTAKSALETAQLALRRAELDLEAATTAKTVLEKFTRPRMLTGLKSQQEAAKARLETRQAAYDLEQATLDRLRAQLANCVILSPRDGVVVYAIERSRWGGQQAIEEGAVVPLGRDILRMPDLTRMQAKVTVSETVVDRVRPGMRALIKLAHGLQYEGEVQYVANQPEQRSYLQPNVTEYSVIVKITEPLDGDIKPGMTTDVVITVDDSHKNVLKVPVPAVVRHGRESFCWVKTKTGVERRSVKLRQDGDKDNPSPITDDTFFVVEEGKGLSEGDDVVLNPRNVVPEARDAEQAATERKEEARPDRTAGGSPVNESSQERSGKPRPTGWKRMDKDGDGKLSRDEAGSLGAAFDGMDKNKDDYLDEAEIAAIEEYREKSSGGGKGGPK